MDHIRKAVERARGPLAPSDHFPELNRTDFSARSAAVAPSSVHEFVLSAGHLESTRIIAHDIADPRSRSFDMLRTQVLQSMDMKSWQFVGVTSATEGCGKSVVSINLALSVARQPERSALLIDLDLQRPRVASYLGLKYEHGILDILDGRASLHDTLVQAKIAKQELLVLPCAAPALSSSEHMASRQMRGLIQDIKRDFRGWTVILDLPPLLTSDDVISILPQLDCVLFVVGAGTTTAEEIKECNRHLESAEVVRVVLNKSEDATAAYYAYSRHAPKSAEFLNNTGGPKARSPRFKAVSKLLKRLSEY